MSFEKRQDWTITLTPHRSLSRQGFVAVMVVVILANIIVGTLFFVLGAWPVLGFMGLDVLLVWWAFRRNNADSAVGERLVARGDTLHLERFSRNGVEVPETFNRPWVSVEIEQDVARELTGQLFLRSHGIRHEIGSFLGAEERLSLAQMLRRCV
jgi:uncharacterized membrane protein